MKIDMLIVEVTIILDVEHCPVYDWLIYCRSFQRQETGDESGKSCVRNVAHLQSSLAKNRFYPYHVV